MKWDAILEHCSFDYMKQHATKRSSAVLFGTAALDVIYRALTVDGDRLTAEESQEQIARSN